MRHLFVLCLMFWAIHAQIKKASIPIVAMVMHKPVTDSLAVKIEEVCAEGIETRLKRGSSKNIWRKMALLTKVKKGTTKVSKFISKHGKKVSTAVEFLVVGLDIYDHMKPDNTASLVEEEVRKQLEKRPKQTDSNGMNEEVIYQLLYHRIVKGSFFCEASRIEHKLALQNYYQVKIRECHKRLYEESIAYTIIAEMVLADSSDIETAALMVNQGANKQAAPQNILAFFIVIMVLRSISLFA